MSAVLVGSWLIIIISLACHQIKSMNPTKMIKAEPCLTHYPTNEVGAHPFTLRTLHHGTNGILHSPKCSKMLKSGSKQNFKKGAAISAMIDPASVVEGQKH